MYWIRLSRPSNYRKRGTWNKAYYGQNSDNVVGCEFSNASSGRPQFSNVSWQDPPSPPPSSRTINTHCLTTVLWQLNGKGYSRYKCLLGTWEVDCAIEPHSQTPPHLIGVLFPTQYKFDTIQPDPFAPASCVRLFLSQRITRIPGTLFSIPQRHIALEDFLLRRLCNAVRHIKELKLPKLSQCILPRSTLIVSKDAVQLRFCLSLPADRRQINARRAVELLTHDIPRLALTSLGYDYIDHKIVTDYIESVEDQFYLISQLPKLNLVAFVPNGAILPRETGHSDLPLTQYCVFFKSPAALETTITLLRRGHVTGMGIPKGVTVIVGGAFHGKSTLLRALQHGFYPKVSRLEDYFTQNYSLCQLLGARRWSETHSRWL